MVMAFSANSTASLPCSLRVKRRLIPPTAFLDAHIFIVDTRSDMEITTQAEARRMILHWLH
jgi:hypothetical protein